MKGMALERKLYFSFDALWGHNIGNCTAADSLSLKKKRDNGWYTISEIWKVYAYSRILKWQRQNLTPKGRAPLHPQWVLAARKAPMVTYFQVGILAISEELKKKMVKGWVELNSDVSRIGCLSMSSPQSDFLVGLWQVQHWPATTESRVWWSSTHLARKFPEAAQHSRCQSD